VSTREFDRLSHHIEHCSIRAGVTILVVCWVVFHVFEDLRGLWESAFPAGEHKANMLSSEPYGRTTTGPKGNAHAGRPSSAPEETRNDERDGSP
jgi:hypothetical protein